MNYYNLSRESELQAALKSIVKAYATGVTQVEFAGSVIRQRTSKKGTDYFTFEAAIPAQASMYKSRSGGGHMVVLSTDLHRTIDLGLAGIQVVNLRVRGHAKFDRSGSPNVFFFDPIAEGEKRGALLAKLDLVERGLVKAQDAFTSSEVEEGRLSGVFSEDKVKELQNV